MPGGVEAADTGGWAKAEVPNVLSGDAAVEGAESGAGACTGVCTGV
jgi:hypothetical protein